MSVLGTKKVGFCIAIKFVLRFALMLGMIFAFEFGFAFELVFWGKLDKFFETVGLFWLSLFWVNIEGVLEFFGGTFGNFEFRF